MSKYRMVAVNFWKDSYIANLDPIEKLLFNYLLTNPYTNLAGIYEINLREIAFDTGIDSEMVQKVLTRFEENGKIIYKNNWIFLCNFLRHQSINPSVLQGIERVYLDLPEWLKTEVMAIWSAQRLSKPLTAWVQSVYKLPVTKPNLTKPNLTKPNGNTTAVAKATDKVSTAEVEEVFSYWLSVTEVKPSRSKQNIDYCKKLLKDHTTEEVNRMIDGVGLSLHDRFAPRIANFTQLYRKWDDLIMWGKRTHNETKTNQGVRI